MIWTLCWFCVVGSLIDAAPIRQTGKGETNAAPQEELNMLIFGVIQVSDSLNYVYETTEAKMVKIHQALQSHEETLQTLEKQTEQAAEVEKQIKEVIQLLQSQMDQDRTDVTLSRDLLSSVQQEEVKLSAKVMELENSLNNSLELKGLQERADEHSNVLQALQHLTQYHQEAIESQNQQIIKLQKMSEAMTFQL